MKMFLFIAVNKIYLLDFKQDILCFIALKTDHFFFFFFFFFFAGLCA